MWFWGASCAEDLRATEGIREMKGCCVWRVGICARIVLFESGWIRVFDLGCWLGRTGELTRGEWLSFAVGRLRLAWVGSGLLAGWLVRWGVGSGHGSRVNLCDLLVHRRWMAEWFSSYFRFVFGFAFGLREGLALELALIWFCLVLGCVRFGFDCFSGWSRVCVRDWFGLGVGLAIRFSFDSF